MELMKKHVDLDSLETLYDMTFEEAALRREFDVRGGSWTLEDGTLVGRNRENCPGMIISQQDFFGPVMLDFEARTIPPCTHDINCMWSGSWDYETNTRALAYVVGLEGWWDGKVGFEKSPEYKLNCGTQLLKFEAGRYYHVQCGSICGHIFCVIDGALALEVMDPDPIDQSRYGKVGFEAYCSQIQIRKFSVKRLSYTQKETKYVPEF